MRMRREISSASPRAWLPQSGALALALAVVGGVAALTWMPLLARAPAPQPTGARLGECRIVLPEWQAVREATLATIDLEDGTTVSVRQRLWIADPRDEAVVRRLLAAAVANGVRVAPCEAGGGIRIWCLPRFVHRPDCGLGDGSCTLQAVGLDELLVASGFSTADRAESCDGDHADRLLEMEVAAQMMGRGSWAGRPVPPGFRPVAGMPRRLVDDDLGLEGSLLGTLSTRPDAASSSSDASHPSFEELWAASLAAKRRERAERVP